MNVLDTMEITREADDLYVSDEYDYIPASVTIILRPEVRWPLRACREFLAANPQVLACEVVDYCFDWSVDDAYDGKARYGRLRVMPHATFFEFSNDWTGTTYECDVTPEVNEYMEREKA